MIKITDKYGQVVQHKKFNFPCGEMQVIVNKDIHFLHDIDVVFEYQNNEEIIELMLVVDALKRIGGELNNLWMPYVPFARQDRVNQFGEAFSLKVFCNLINEMGFRKVVIHDPHSDVVSALLNNVQIMHQHMIWEECKHLFKDSWLVAPDAGAVKKIHKVAERVHPFGVITAEKQRDILTGEITETKCYTPDLFHRTCIIIDDICDGGKTFVELAKVLKKQNAGKVILCVTHGFFTKGIEVFDGLIDEIYTLKGQIKPSPKKDKCSHINSVNNPSFLECEQCNPKEQKGK